jgi:hypothetical protein
MRHYAFRMRNAFDVRRVRSPGGEAMLRDATGDSTQQDKTTAGQDDRPDQQDETI